MIQTALPLTEPGPDLPQGVIFRPRAFAMQEQAALLEDVRAVTTAAPLARLQTKGGGLTSAAMTNCGVAGWWSEAKGYRYVTAHPVTGRPWPEFPPRFLAAVRKIARDSLWPDFAPDACLINFYEPGAKMGLHQDKDEKDFAQPIITVCLGDDADFLIGGFARGDKTKALIVRSGDALIMGGASRMLFHGIRKIYPGTSPLPGVGGRFSLTFRKALS